MFAAGLFLIPVVVSLLVNLPVLFSRYDRPLPSMLWLLAGFGFFILLFVLFGAPVRTYILEHELSHVLVAVLTGVRVKKLSLRRDRAYVRTERVTPLIALVPFAMPLYTLALGLAYRLAQRWLDHPAAAAAAYAVIGMSLSFHLVATAHYLQLEQPDLHRYGVFGSLVLVCLWSILMLAVLSALLFEKVDLAGYLERVFLDGLAMYGSVVRGLAGMLG